MKFKELIDTEVPKDDSTSEGEKMILYWLIKEMKPKVVVETGTHRALTSLYMAHALYENGQGHLTTYDPYEWGQKGNIGKFPELMSFITYKQQAGTEMSEEQIDFAFIDGYHGFKDAFDEIRVLMPRLAKNATVIFHDCWPTEEGGIDVNGAIETFDLKNVFLPTKNAIRIYNHES